MWTNKLWCHFCLSHWKYILLQFNFTRWELCSVVFILSRIYRKRRSELNVDNPILGFRLSMMGISLIVLCLLGTGSHIFAKADELTSEQFVAVANDTQCWHQSRWASKWILYLYLNFEMFSLSDILSICHFFDWRECLCQERRVKEFEELFLPEKSWSRPFGDWLKRIVDFKTKVKRPCNTSDDSPNGSSRLSTDNRRLCVSVSYFLLFFYFKNKKI